MNFSNVSYAYHALLSSLEQDHLISLHSSLFSYEKPLKSNHYYSSIPLSFIQSFLPSMLSPNQYYYYQYDIHSIHHLLLMTPVYSSLLSLLLYQLILNPIQLLFSLIHLTFFKLSATGFIFEVIISSYFFVALSFTSSSAFKTSYSSSNIITTLTSKNFWIFRIDRLNKASN